MAVEAGARQQERVAGWVWTVRLDPHGRPSAGAVKLSCSRPACADQRVPGGAAAGRKAAIGHVNTPGPHPRGRRAARRGVVRLPRRRLRVAHPRSHCREAGRGEPGGGGGAVRRPGGPDGVRGPDGEAVADRGDVRAVRGRHPRLPGPGHRPARLPHRPGRGRSGMGRTGHGAGARGRHGGRGCCGGVLRPRPLPRLRRGFGCRAGCAPPRPHRPTGTSVPADEAVGEDRAADCAARP